MATLRELRTSDAASLLAMLGTEEVARFISPPPTTIEDSRNSFAGHSPAPGRQLRLFAVVPAGYDTAVGLFQSASSSRASRPPNGGSPSGQASGERESFWNARDGRRLCVRNNRRAPAGSTVVCAQRSRERCAAKGWCRAGRCARRSFYRMVSISIKCSGRFCARTGIRRRPSGAQSSLASKESFRQATEDGMGMRWAAIAKSLTKAPLWTSLISTSISPPISLLRSRWPTAVVPVTRARSPRRCDNSHRDRRVTRLVAARRSSARQHTRVMAARCSVGACRRGPSSACCLVDLTKSAGRP